MTTHNPHPRLPLTLEPHLPFPLGPFDPETNINPPLHLIQLPRNPRNLTRKVNLIAQNRSRFRVRPYSIQRTTDDGTGSFLVVENRQRGTHDDEGKEGDGADPAVAVAAGYGGEFAVGSSFH